MSHPGALGARSRRRPLTAYLLPLLLLIAQLSLGLTNFDRTLSPRQVKTKYGFLRGILIFRAKDNAQNSGSQTSAASSSASSSANSSPTPGPGPPPASGQPATFGTVEAFLGVPYATPPVGSLRFMPPVTPSHWRGVRMANNYGHACPQKWPDANGFDVESSLLSLGRQEFLGRFKPFLENFSEDCLYLNIFLPQRKGE